MKKITFLVLFAFCCLFGSTMNAQNPPTAVCMDITVQLDAGGTVMIIATDVDGGSFEIDGDPLSYSVDIDTFNCADVAGPVLVTLTVSDIDGSDSCTAFVTVEDNVPPGITCPADITVSNDPGVCGATVTYMVPTSDNCPGETTVQTAGQASGTVFPIGTTTNTFVVTDASGNTATCSFDVTVNDTEDPTITCPADITVSNDPGVCGATVTYTVPTSDNCPGETTVQTAGQASGTVFPVGTTTNTFVVTDASGNTATCSFDVTVNDTEDPTITCPADITVSNDPGVCGATVTYTVPTSDNCPGETTVQTAGQASGTVFPIGTTTNTFVVTDASGNTATCSFDVTVNDTEDPTITCPADITVSNDPGVCGATVTYTVPTSDNCPGETTVQTAGQASGTVFPVGTTTNTFVVTDASGNTATCSFDVTVNDTEDPIIGCPADITVSNDPGVCGATVAYGVAFSDNCPGATLAQTAGQASGTVFPVGTTTNTFVVTDASGNTATCSFDITVNDTEPPVIACPADITQDNDPGVCGAAVTWTAPVGTDNCPASTTTSTHNPGDTFPVGTTTVTYTVTDASGNMANCSFDVTVNDTEDPTITCPADITVSNDPGVCGAAVTYSVTSSDNCPGETIAQTAGLPSGSTFPVGTTTNTFVVTDASGNTATCSFDVTITDNEAPNAVCLGPTTYLSSDFEGGTGGWTTGNDATTICGSGSIPSTWNLATQTAGSAPVTLGTTWYGMPNYGNLGAERSWIQSPILTATTAAMDVNFDSYTSNEGGYPTNYDVEHVQVSINAGAFTDVHGNDPQLHTGNDQTFRNITYSIAVTSGDQVQFRFLLDTCDSCCGPSNISGWYVDNVVISSPATPIDVVLDATGNASITTADIDGGSTDNCGIASMSVSPSTFTCADIGINIVTLTVTDIHGNVSTCTSEVNVIDDMPPVAVCQDITVQLDATGNVSITADQLDGGSTDNCAITFSASQTDFDCSDVGVVVVTLTVTDEGGNTDTCTANVTVEDNILPSITCPADITQSNDPGVCEAVVTWTAPVGTDNCPNTVTTSTHNPGDIFPVGTTTVTYTATDASGNTAMCSFNVIVNDDEDPVISCPADVNTNTDPGECSAVVTFPDALALDNCGVMSVVQTDGLPSGSMFPVGVNTVEFTATDIHGNTTVCAMTITVTDNEPPMAVCMDITIQLDANGDATITPADIDGGSTDNCGVASLDASQTVFDCSDVGANNVTLTVTDVNGNTSTCIAVVTVEDVTDPVAVCMNITVELDVNGTVTILPTDVDGGSSDACGVDTYELDIDTFTCADVGVNVVTLTVTDVNGNVSSCTAEVTVEDNIDPDLVCMDITVELDENGFAEIVPEDVMANNTDACGIDTTGIDIFEFSCDDIGTPVTVTVFSVDNNGNVTACQAEVTVVDLLAPIVTCPADQTVDPGVGNLFWEVEDYFALGTASATDNCTDPVTILTQDPAPGTLLPDGVYTITISGEDEYGNIGTCTFELTVESILGVNDNTIDVSTIVMYPNPARNVVNISNPQSIDLDQATIYDVTGRLIQTYDLRDMGTEKALDISNLSTATYLVLIQGPDGQITKQLIKE